MTEDSYTPAQRHMLELHRAHRSVDLNVRYYGARASSAKDWNRSARIVAAVGSSAAIVGLFAGFSAAVLILAAVTALATILAPLFLWDQQALRFEKLHFCYSDLLQDFTSHIRSITLAGTVTPEHQAVSWVLLERRSRLGAHDETKPDRPLIDQFTGEVKKAIPISSLWMPPAA